MPSSDSSEHATRQKGKRKNRRKEKALRGKVVPQIESASRTLLVRNLFPTGNYAKTAIAIDGLTMGQGTVCQRK